MPTSTIRPGDARELALAVERESLRKAVEQGLRVDAAQADELITFLTFQFQTGGPSKAKGNKGLWAAPLVPVPGTTEVVLPLSVLTTSNIVRRVEAWLEKGGIDDTNPITWPTTSRRSGSGKAVPSTTQGRGDRYETLYRHQVCDAIVRNTMFAGAACARHGIKKSKTFPEQVDLLVAFGGVCLVGEVKFFLMPADPHERARYDEKLSDAAKQAKIKLSALKLQPDVLANALGIDIEAAKALELVPVVVTAQGYRFSTRVDEVLIVESSFLRTYLAGEKVVVGMAIVPATGEHVQHTKQFYSSEKAAAREFESTMEAPYVLKRFLNQISWSDTPLPTLAHPRAVIEMPEIKDLTGFERVRAEAMAAALRTKR
ncbi:hypothetical protein [Candidatus Aquicultor sp.]